MPDLWWEAENSEDVQDLSKLAKGAPSFCRGRFYHLWETGLTGLEYAFQF